MVLNTYHEQEGIVEETFEQVIFQDNDFDSSNSSSDNCTDSSKSGVLLQMDELLWMLNSSSITIFANITEKLLNL
jgi:hypothetical protein